MFFIVAHGEHEEVQPLTVYMYLLKNSNSVPLAHQKIYDLSRAKVEMLV